MTWNVPKTNWNARKKSFAYAGTLIVVASGFLVAAAVDAQGVLSPFVQGFEWVAERSLSGHTDSLTVVVGRYIGGETSRIAGAAVEVQRMVPGEMYEDEPGHPKVDFTAKGAPANAVT